MSSWIEVGKTGKLTKEAMKEVLIKGQEILLTRVGDNYYASDNRCPHMKGCPRMPFSPNSALCSKNYPRNINYIPAVIFFASLDFGKNCYSRTAS